MRALSGPSLRAALVVGAVVLADQLSKRAVEDSITPGEERKFLPGISFVHDSNHGVAFGLQPGSNAGITIAISIALAALLAYFARHRDERLVWLPTGMLFGGAIGNIVDRVGGGGVTDFIKLPLGCCCSCSPTTTAPARVNAFEIAYEDEHLLVVDKGPGVVVHPGRGHADDTLAQLLAHTAAGGDASRAGIVHRLDRDTSGLLVVARSEEAHRRLQAALARRELRREYLALVDGVPPARSGTIDAPVGRDARVRTRMTVGGAHAREARTHFELERALADAALLRLRLETGRTHQIRVHLRAIGHPVCGDPEYGSAGRFGLQRQFLHATRLAFEHPFGGESIDVTSPLPEDLVRALQSAEKLS
jgi:23S rRNA pseudouridine1911/1915/1917 synthase